MPISVTLPRSGELGSATWTNVPAGSYSLTAVATDNLGQTTTSPPVAITVEGAEGLPAIEGAVRELASRDPSSMILLVEEAALEGLQHLTF